MRMRAILCLSEHCFPGRQDAISDTADWQAHFLGLRVQKTISHLTLIISQPSLANSAHLPRVIGFSHRLLQVKQMSFLPCGTLSRN